MKIIDFLDGDGRLPNCDIHQDASTPDELKDLFHRDWMAFYSKFDILDDVFAHGEVYRAGKGVRSTKWAAFTQMVELSYLSKLDTEHRNEEFMRLSDPAESPFFDSYRGEMKNMCT